MIRLVSAAAAAPAATVVISVSTASDFSKWRLFIGQLP